MTTRLLRRLGAERLGVGLHQRVTLAFALIAIALSVGLSLVTWTAASHFLVQRQSTTAQNEIADNATVIENQLSEPVGASVASVLDSLPLHDQSAALLVFDGDWYSSSLAQGPDVLPRQLVNDVRSGVSEEQRIELAGKPALVIGVAFRRTGDAYFEIFPLAQLDSTLHTLSLTLLVVGCLAAGLGLLLGRAAGRRALLPLRRFTSAASVVAAGDLNARVPVGRDPELTLLAQSFNETAEALQHRVQADARFAADVSHELRTPVTTMVNAIELLDAHHAELPADVREQIQLLATDLGRFRRLVVDLLEISRYEVDPADAAVESVRIADLVRLAADHAAGRRVTSVDDDVVGLTIVVDKRRLERVVANLVDNAELHGGGCASVHVVRAGAVVKIVVDDCGPGVPMELRQRIFERFARGTARTCDEGSGLGLAIVARHVYWHGGLVYVEDSPLGGARFVVELPVEVARVG